MKKLLVPFVPFWAYGCFENWLSKMSKCGYRLHHYTFLTYSFIKCKPFNGLYFLYSSAGHGRNEDGQYFMQFRTWADSFRLANRYLMLNKKPLKYSAINIVELDCEKINSKDYFNMVKERDKMQLLFHLKYHAAGEIASLVFLLFFKHEVVKIFSILLLSYCVLDSIIGCVMFLRKVLL